ncbi:MAG TPA: hypothetical protein VFD80_08625 [Flavobacteriaceae bacterium]|nr:hypothetical protein [Flavobacteriaceae bacterium]
MKNLFAGILFLAGNVLLAQQFPSNYRNMKVAVQDTIVIDSTSINPSYFEIKGRDGVVIDTVNYNVNFEEGLLYLTGNREQIGDSIEIAYLKYPSFLTKKYARFDADIIVKDRSVTDRLYALQQSTRDNTFTPFDGLNTSGSISRGITIGNNQNAVVTSELDLQITGKISDKVSIRASIQDANIPMQEGGYSQGLDEFDEIFIELFSDTWSIRAGDIDLINQESFFGRFQKKVQGIALGGKLKGENSETDMFLSGAVVRGVFSRSTFVGQEGNQGPYKLIGPNGEMFILIISGSERVYVNGLLLERGENKDYMIDYNAGELRFNATFPITADMRILVEYQYTDNNYTRFIGYGGGKYTSEKLDIGAYAYMESDMKNQPLQQNLTQEQVEILQQAGDDPSQMLAPSAVPDTYSDNKILYRKELFQGEEIFVFSNNPEDELFNVRFTLVGENLGNYVIANNAAINRIFEYIPPVNGVPQGNYEPVIRLVAPTMLQVGGVTASYRATEKTTVDLELAASKKDNNLFSDLDSEDNAGFAGKIGIQQNLIQKESGVRLDALLGIDYIHQNFNTIERLYDVEFNRDWTLENPLGNQSLVSGGLQLSDPKVGMANYRFEKLDFSENFSGNRHSLNSVLRFGKLQTRVNTSLLDNRSDTYTSGFFRLNLFSAYTIGKGWVGAKINAEDNQQRVVANDSLTPISQKFIAYETFAGIGDSTKVFVEIGYRHRINDSVRMGNLEQVSVSNTYYLKSQLISNEQTQLSIFANYRTLDDVYGNRQQEQSLNSRVLFNQSFFNRAVQWNTTFETNSGVVPQQEFTFIEVETGQGTHIWIDYNENGIQELEEFEPAQFPGEGNYIRVLLPNQIFVKIHQNHFGQTLSLNPQQFTENENTKKFLAKFHNQTSYLIDRKTLREGKSFNINPFSDGNENQLGLNLNFRNVLFFNRGKQRYTTSYTYTATSAENLLSVGLQRNNLRSHQLQFTHKFANSWLGNLRGQWSENQTNSENFAARNFMINGYEFSPKISYLFSENAQFGVGYQHAKKKNSLGNLETLNQEKLTANITYNQTQKWSINGEFNYIINSFSGNSFSPVAFQMLEGLQPDKNFTWSLLLQRSITKYLDANLSYFGRKSENSNTIHTGSVQLKAYF